MKIRDLSPCMTQKHNACIFDNDIKNQKLKWKDSCSTADHGHMAHDAYEIYKDVLEERLLYYGGTTTNTNRWRFVSGFTNSWV